MDGIKEKLMRGIMAMQSLYLQEKIDIDSIGNKKLLISSNIKKILIIKLYNS